VPPAGYGRALCMHEDSSLTSAYPGYCPWFCADATGTFPCPMGLNCKAPPPDSCTGFFYRPSSDVSVCRGGYYRHGDGDDVIEPGELYGIMRTETPVCDPNLGQTTAAAVWIPSIAASMPIAPRRRPPTARPSVPGMGSVICRASRTRTARPAGTNAPKSTSETFGTDVSPGCD